MTDLSLKQAYINQITQFLGSPYPLMASIDLAQQLTITYIETITAHLTTSYTVLHIDASSTSDEDIISTLEANRQYAMFIIITQSELLSKTVLKQIMHYLTCDSSPIKNRALLLGSTTLTTLLKTAYRQKENAFSLPFITFYNNSTQQTTHANKISAKPQIINNKTIKQHRTRITALAGLVIIILYLSWQQHHHINNLPILPADNSKNTAIDYNTDRSNNINFQNKVPISQKNSKKISNNKITPIDSIKQAPNTMPPQQPSIIYHIKNDRSKIEAPKKNGGGALKNIIATKTDKHFFIIQLMSASQPIKLRAFITKHQLNKIAHIYTTTLHGNNWYLLGYQQFSSIKEAHSALKNLPPLLKLMHPWVRPMQPK